MIAEDILFSDPGYPSRRIQATLLQKTSTALIHAGDHVKNRQPVPVWMEIMAFYQAMIKGTLRPLMFTDISLSPPFVNQGCREKCFFFGSTPKLLFRTLRDPRSDKLVYNVYKSIQLLIHHATSTRKPLQ